MVRDYSARYSNQELFPADRHVQSHHHPYCPSTAELRKPREGNTLRSSPMKLELVFYVFLTPQLEKR
jgi:hypothetical protein